MPSIDSLTPLGAFNENRGQWSALGDYLLRTRGIDVWARNAAIVFHHHRSHTVDSVRLGPAGSYTPTRVHRSGSVVSMRFVGSAGSRIEPVDPLPGTLRSYVGPREQWVDSIRRFASLRYRGLYPGIDMVLSLHGGPRYSFVVAPGVDPAQIQWTIEGAEEIDLLDDAMSIATSVGRIEHRGLVAFQEINGSRTTVRCRYTRTRNAIGFAIGPYDREYPLVIDPVIFSIMIGGTDYERPGGSTVDREGNLMIVGTTQSVDLPVTVGAYDGTYGAPTEAFAMKVDPFDRRLVWGTFLGGEDGEGGNAAALAADGGLVAAGLTASLGFPTTNGVVSAWFGGGIDAFVARLDADGRLRFATYLGGDGIDAAAALALDGDTILVAGSTTSVDFPGSEGGIDSSVPSAQAYVLRLASDGAMLYDGIALGGGGEDYCYALTRDLDNTVVLGGVTASTDFPTTAVALQKTLARDDTSRFDFFVVRLDRGLDSVMAATYLGGRGDENGTRIATRSDGAVIIGGYTPSNDFPTTSQKVGRVFGGDVDMVVGLLSSDLSTLRYACYLGGSDQDRLFSIVADEFDRLLLTGDARSTTMPTSQGAFDAIHNGSSDVYIAIVDPLLDSLVYGSYLGGGASDIGYTIQRIGPSDFILTGATSSDDFPSTTEPHDSLKYTDVFVVRLQIPDTSSSAVSRSSVHTDRNPSMIVDRFGDRLRIRLQLPAATITAIDAYDLLGRRVSTIAPTRRYEQGTHELWVDAARAGCLLGWRYGGVFVQ